MKACPQCQRPVSIWIRDLATGLCPSCQQLMKQEVDAFQATGGPQLVPLDLTCHGCCSRTGSLTYRHRDIGEYRRAGWFTRTSVIDLNNKQHLIFKTTGIFQRRCLLVEAQTGRILREAESRPSWGIVSDTWNLKLGMGPALLNMVFSTLGYMVRHDGRIVAVVRDSKSGLGPARRGSRIWSIRGTEELNELDLLLTTLVCHRSRGPLLTGPSGS